MGGVTCESPPPRLYNITYWNIEHIVSSVGLLIGIVALKIGLRPTHLFAE